MHAQPASPASARDDANAQTAGDDGWCLRQSRYVPGDQARDESLFALANGSLGVRGNFEESISTSDGCYLASVYERHPIEFHERLPGFASHTDTRVPIADGKHIAIALGDESLDTSTCEWREFSRTLDLRTGVVRRRARLRTPQGATIDLESERLICLDANVLAIRFRVTSVDYAGPLTLSSTIRAGQRSARQGEDPRIGVIGSHRLTTLATLADADLASLAQRVPNSGIVVCCAQTHGIGDDGLHFLGADADEQRAVQRYGATLSPGHGVVLEKFVAYASTGEHADDADAPIANAAALAKQAAQDGYDALADAHAAALAAFWRDADIGVSGDAATSLSLRFNLFHVLQSASRSARSGTAAKGLTGEGYEGHCFWDTEVFVLPVMVYTAPWIARSMLGWRHRTLDAARANARAMNHASGALYPWRTIAGAECSAHYPSGSAAYHINADIAYAIGLYLDATDDIAFVLEAGAEMLFETARIWPQAGHFDPARDGAFGIHDVTGPDEYTALVDNNFYTNRMAQQHLLRAVAVWEQLSASHPSELRALAERLALTADEIETWRRAADAMALPVDARLDIFAQDDTFLHKPRWDMSGHRHDRPLLLDYHPLTLYRHQVCKQADVVMALVLAGDGFDAGRKRRSFDYYEAITTHDSTLSPAIHGILASELGLHHKALRYFDLALRTDLDDLHGNTGHGVHMACMAGSWLGIAWGFAGLRVVYGALAFAPTLPPDWQGYRFGLHWRGKRVQVDVASDGVEYRVEGGALSIAHHGQALHLRPGAAIRVALQPTGANAAMSLDTFPRECRALVFDLDGVLTDTAQVHYRAWKRMADEIGVPFDETVNLRLKGVSRATSLDIILERADRSFSTDEKHALAERKNGYYREAIVGFGPDDLFPGARELLRAAHARGLKTALASASHNAPALLRQLGIADCFEAVADPSSARAKPHPDLFLAAAAAIDVAPSHCIGIEDAAAGVAAIKAAGMAAVGIGEADDLWQADAVLPAIADFRLDSFVSAQ